MATEFVAILSATTLLMPQDGTAMRSGTLPDVIHVEVVAARDASERIRFDDVVILARGEDNRTIACGILDAHLAVKGQLPSGDTAYFYIPWCFPTKAAPPVSDHCRFDVRLDTWPPGGYLLGETDIPKDRAQAFERRYNVVEDFDCERREAPAP